MARILPIPFSLRRRSCCSEQPSRSRWSLISVQLAVLVAVVLVYPLAAVASPREQRTADPVSGRYVVTSVANTAYGLEANLSYAGDHLPFNAAANLTMRAYWDERYRLRVRVYNSDDTVEFSLPQSLLQVNTTVTGVAFTEYNFSYTNDPFGFAVVRQADGYVLFNCTPPANATGQPAFAGLQYETQNIQLTTQLQKGPYVYGLGERVESLRLPVDSVYTLWARGDALPGVQPSHRNLYSTLPCVCC